MRKRNNLEVFLSSETGKRFFNFFYSWGAAVVIIGAMFKIIHLPYADIVLMVGMITEALVFFVSGFDNSSNDSNAETLSKSGVLVSGDIGNLATAGGTTGQKESSSGGSSVVLIGGGVGTGRYADGSNVNPVVSGTSAVPTTATRQVGKTASESMPSSQSVSDTAQNLEDFSQTIQSLNEASQKLLNACNQISGTDGFVDNITTLNQNVSGLNDVFNAQLQTITEQMSAVRYINDSLSRMKNLYDGAIGDSYMFKEESAKMTKHIEALNNVYARLLQAMTTNNNPNPNNFR